MALLKIPTRNDIPAYSLRTELDGAAYTLSFRWNGVMERWIMDMADAVGQPLVLGIVLNADMPVTEQYRESIDGMPPGPILVLDETGAQRPPDLETFGLEVSLNYRPVL